MNGNVWLSVPGFHANWHCHLLLLDEALWHAVPHHALSEPFADYLKSATLYAAEQDIELFPNAEKLPTSLCPKTTLDIHSVMKNASWVLHF